MMPRCLLLLGTSAAVFVWKIDKRKRIPSTEEYRAERVMSCQSRVVGVLGLFEAILTDVTLQRHHLRHRSKRLDACRADRLTRRSHIFEHI
jgi:hypothetical protein